MQASMWITGDTADLRAATDGWRAERASIGFVPTMGALHEGHLSLVRKARAENDKVIVSIFVNPTQFGPNEDFSRYPRTPEKDSQFLSNSGVDILYMPSPADMYDGDAKTSVHLNEIGDHLEGPFRPGHFDGVATVVAKLLLRVGATSAYFGEKDWQQLQIVKQMARDLDIPARVIGCPIIREPDGLALSSRNMYLSEGDRKTASLINRVLADTAAAIHRHPEDIDGALIKAHSTLEAAGFKIDYVECAIAASCTPVRNLNKPARLFVAARIGTTRLIDNWPL
jgi:pantoate--beta-alanine ligase